MRVFVAHLIVMGILKKNSLEQYWSRGNILNTPFFGHYMSRNCFQNILWNLHISDPDEMNPQKGEADHDPLFLVRTMVDMMQRNFCTKFRPGKELSLDDSMCPFKGRVYFKCYNPKKPNRFYIILFMVIEPSTGYICGFEVYTLPSTWLIDTLLSPYQAKKGVGESTQAMLVLYVMSAKRHCQMLVLGTVTNPKSSPFTGVQYVSVHCVLILVLGYITFKRTTQVKY